MSKIILVNLEWNYSPETYLEEPILIEFEGGELEIKNGKALAKIDPETFQRNESIREDLTKKIESRLHAVQIMTHKAFELSKPRRADIREDGKNKYFLELESCINITCFGHVDILVHDKDGNVVSDSKRERLDKQQRFAELVEKHRVYNGTLDQMLKSYQQSVSDPNNELIHLYEIRDALSKKFGGKPDALKALSISKSEWNEIGKLANTLPLNQGRHRGQSVGALRDADPSELEMARKSVVNLIEKYLDFLEASQNH